MRDIPTGVAPENLACAVGAENGRGPSTARSVTASEWALTSDDRVAAVEDLGTAERMLIDDGELVAELHSGLLAVYRRDLGNLEAYLRGLVRSRTGCRQRCQGSCHAFQGDRDV